MTISHPLIQQISLVHQSKRNNRVQPNQSLKLTEPAVGDFARANQPATIGHDLARADWIPSLRRFAAAA